jgi:tetratricopeptide (TPR) repeat protein
MPEHAEGQRAVIVAFRQYYEAMSGALDGLLTSKDAQQRQLGQVLVRLEYENLMTALQLALDAQVSIMKLYVTLSAYLDATKDERRGLVLGEAVLPRLQAYPTAALSGRLGAELIGVLDDIARRQLELKQYAAAEASYRETLRLLVAQTTLDRKTREGGKAGVLHQLGAVAQEQRQWGQAEQYYQQALAIKIELQDRYSQASTYHQLGAVAQEQRQWGQAEQYHHKVLAILVEFKDRYSQARTYHQLGIVAQEQQQWGQAEQYYQQALAIWVEFKDRYSQARTYDNLGIVAQEQQQWGQAEQYYQQALAIWVEFEDRSRQARTYDNLGMVAQEQQQWGQAEQYYQQVLAIWVEFKDRYEQAGTYHQLGRVAEEQRQWGQARDYFLKALAITAEFDDYHVLAITLRSLGHLRQASHDTDLTHAIASILQTTPEYVETWLAALLSEEAATPKFEAKRRGARTAATSTWLFSLAANLLQTLQVLLRDLSNRVRHKQG